MQGDIEKNRQRARVRAEGHFAVQIRVLDQHLPFHRGYLLPVRAPL